MGLRYSLKKDSWSLGILLYVFLKGKFLYQGKSDESLLEDIMNKEKLLLNFTEGIDEHVRHLIHHLL